ncbi:MAG: hypothetical protein R2759_07485 [Bacteroidales bacterium]
MEDTGVDPLEHPLRRNGENAAKVAEDSIRAGMRYLVLPSLGPDYRKDMDGYKRAAEDFNKIGRFAKSAGISFGYHNHGFEFEKMNGEVPYNVLLQNTDPGRTCFHAGGYLLDGLRRLRST